MTTLAPNQDPEWDAVAPLVALVRPGGAVLAVTGDGTDPAYAAVRAAAVRVARPAFATVILYHAPASAGPAGGSPRLFDPVGVAGDPAAGGESSGPRVHTGTRRRDLLHAEAIAVRSNGPEVRVWLSRRSGPSGLAEAAAATGASLILIPAESDRRRSGRGRVIPLTLSYYAARVSAPLVAVRPDGSTMPVAPLQMAVAPLQMPVAPLQPRPTPGTPRAPSVHTTSAPA